MYIDFGISVVYNASAQVKDMIYRVNGIPAGVKAVLSWDAVMHADTYLRKYLDDIISAILSMWCASLGSLPWLTEKIETAWIKQRNEYAKIETLFARLPFHNRNYTNIASVRILIKLGI